MDPTIIAAVAGDLSTCENEIEKCRVLSTVEMVGGFMELVSLQLAEQPAEIQPRWQAYVVDAYNSSVVMREHVASCAAWYADDFLRPSSELGGSFSKEHAEAYWPGENRNVTAL